MTPTQRQLSIQYHALYNYLIAMEADQTQYEEWQELQRQAVISAINAEMSAIQSEYGSVPPPPPDPADF